MKQIRKAFPSLLLLSGLLLVFQAVLARPADIEVEVFYLPHQPAMVVVGKVEQVAKEFVGVTLRKYSFDDQKSRKMLDKYQLTEHMPVAVFINGKDSFTVGDRTMRLRNFPKGDSFVPTFAGEWDYDDLRAILAGLVGEKR